MTSSGIQKLVHLEQEVSEQIRSGKSADGFILESWKRKLREMLRCELEVQERIKGYVKEVEQELGLEPSEKVH